MQCGGCGTILEEGQLTCPNCGRMVWSRGAGKRQARKPSPLAKPSDSASRVELELSEPAATKPAAARARPAPAAAAPSSLTPDPASVLRLLAEDPGLLEKGMTVLSEKGRSVGVDYPTDVGEIDLLARDSGGALVVVMVVKGEKGADVVADILQRIGWVRKHVAKTREGVRGIVVMDKAPDNLSYAATAVADTVAFRTFRMTLTFDEVEI